MKLGWEEHFEHVVIATWQEYLLAEDRLTAASEKIEWQVPYRESVDALRHGGTAVLWLHHFLEIVLNETPDFIETSDIKQARKWLAAVCTHLRGDKQVDDVQLLCDTADALKHAQLRDDTRLVAKNDSVLVVGLGYGQLALAEGKFGGPPQVLVVAKTGNRALSAVLQNVIDAWRRRMGVLQLPPIGQP